MATGQLPKLPPDHSSTDGPERYVLHSQTCCNTVVHIERCSSRYTLDTLSRRASYLREVPNGEKTFPQFVADRHSLEGQPFWAHPWQERLATSGLRQWRVPAAHRVWGVLLQNEQFLISPLYVGTMSIWMLENAAKAKDWLEWNSVGGPG